MSKQRSYGSLFWALTLMGLGGILLANNMGYAIPWRDLATYWPVLIIGWGLLKVVDYYRLRNKERSVFSGGEIVLLIFVILAGTSFTAAANVGSDLGFIGLIGEEFDLFDVVGESHRFDSEIRADVEPGRVIEIENRYGTVEVEPGAAGEIVVSVQKNVRATTREAAEELEPELSFSIEERGGRYVVSSNRDRLRESVRRRFRTSLVVRVPPDSSLDIDNSYGPVRMMDLTGDQVVENRYGAVTLARVDGEVRIQDRYGPVSAEDVSGDVSVVNRYGAVTVRRVGGGATIENRYAPIEITELTGSASIRNRYSRIELQQVGGGARVEGRNNRVDLDGIQGAVDVDTSYRNVEARNLSDSVQIANRHGDILLEFQTAPSGDVTLTGEYSDVRIELPSGSEFSFEAQVRSGSFNSDFDDFDRETQGRNLRVTGREGNGGPRITINTARGSVRLAGR